MQYYQYFPRFSYFAVTSWQNMRNSENIVLFKLSISAEKNWTKKFGSNLHRTYIEIKLMNVGIS